MIDSGRKKRRKSFVNLKMMPALQNQVTFDRIMDILKSYFISKIRSNMLFKDFNKKNLSFL
jgi:hypothetical protein